VVWTTGRSPFGRAKAALWKSSETFEKELDPPETIPAGNRGVSALPIRRPARPAASATRCGHPPLDNLGTWRRYVAAEAPLVDLAR
jgi:hypothetical protein